VLAGIGTLDLFLVGGRNLGIERRAGNQESQGDESIKNLSFHFFAILFIEVMEPRTGIREWYTHQLVLAKSAAPGE
jgi:hypothetical protein